jgi:hypothetical protein
LVGAAPAVLTASAGSARLRGGARAGLLPAVLDRGALFAAYAFAATLMCAAAVIALWLGIDAERKPLEEVARPLGYD